MSILNFSDVDECSADTDNCTQNCENTDGSFTCSCNDGYTTTDNGITCDGMILSTFWNMTLQMITTSSTMQFYILKIYRSKVLVILQFDFLALI